MDNSRRSYSHRFIDWFVESRSFLLVGVFVITVGLAFFIPGMKPDPTMKSGISTTSREYRQYQEFLAEFGNEEFILIAMKNNLPANDPRILTALDNITERLQEYQDIEEVVSLTNLSFFQEVDGRFGGYKLIRNRNGKPVFPDRGKLQRLREFIPVLDLLLSGDLKTVGFIVKISERCRLNPPLIDKVLKGIDSVLRADAPAGSDFRVIGGPVIRHAVQKYNLQTAITFGLLCSLIATLVAFYIFKSLRVSLITTLVVGICVVWMMGLMSILDVRLNSTTALSFGLVLIVSAAAVIHIATHYNERYSHLHDRVEAAKQALMVVGRPCLMCSLTTATGFASITVSNIPMVRQVGLIMALGVLISYLLALIVAPALLIMFKPPSPRAYSRMSGDWVAVAFNRLEAFVFAHYRVCAAAGLVFILLMASGAPRIHSDTQILRMLTDRTKEVQDIRFVEQNLAPVHSLELTIDVGDRALKTPEPWAKVAEIERRLKTIPEVAGTDSLVSVLKYLGEVAGAPSTGELFGNPRLIPQLLAMTSFSSGGKEILSRYINEGYNKSRISVRIVNSPSTPIGDTIERIRATAAGVMKGTGEVVVTGDLAVFASQSSELVRAQTLSLFIAITCITILMIIQFRSLLLGILSLIPNVLPLAVIFGLMGWFRISLDSVTIFAATMSIGLSVDDTIHYLTQLKREIRSARGAPEIEECLASAYRITAKALISTSVVLYFGLLMLVISPFRPVIFFGVLGSSAIVAALVGDLVLMPAVILSVPFIKRLVNKEMAQETTT